MDKWKGRTALVTGASTGIGAAVVKKLTASGVNVVGCARNFENLKVLQESQPPGSFYPIKCDVSEEDEIEKMFDEIKQKFGGIDICINNAGINLIGTSLIDGDPKKWKKIWDINVFGVCLCAKAAIASMRERSVDDGYIVNVNSLGGHRVIPPPDSHLYSATKFAITALTEGLRQELKKIGSHIRISMISPGYVDTAFFLRRQGQDYDKNKADQTVSELKEKLQINKLMDGNDIAENIIFMLSTPPHVQIHDIQIRSTEDNV